MLEYGRARRDEEAELLDFANMVFSLAREPVDFLLAQPKVYSVPGFADISMVAREDGRIKGLVNAIHGTLILGEERLRYGYVGTVSAHPYERGRGIMKTLMNMVMERLEQEGCHFLALGGQRQRYGYFGFEDAGAAITLRFTEASIHHAPEAGPGGALRIMSMDEAGEDALGKARALHGVQALRCDRGKWDFLKLLRTE
ncbi:MAG TPA: GNAT family N-acetyltransferase, partial [Candidatus Limnocylindria bacterium]|nr:GNAT family N-acetyltransferase [Candidatus Limnocylindria bacterium]